MRGFQRIAWHAIVYIASSSEKAKRFRFLVCRAPGYIQPLHGIRTKTRWYGAVYALARPFYPLLKLFPNCVTTTEFVGRAMLNVTKRGFAKPVIENRDINRVCMN